MAGTVERIARCFPWRFVAQPDAMCVAGTGHQSVVADQILIDPVAAQSAFKISQQFMSHELDKRGLLNYWPKEWCVSFKNHCIPRYWRSYFQDPFIPEGAKIVVFAGNLKMQDVVDGGGSTWYRRIGNIDWLIRQWN